MTKLKNKKINGTLLLNIFVIFVALFFVVYFCVSDQGLFDFIRSGQTIIAGWILLAIFSHFFNIFVDSIVTFMFLRSMNEKVSLWDGVKISMVGQFFSAITPSATGGQPMQVYLMSKMNIGVGVAFSAMMQKFIVYQVVTTLFSIIAIVVRADFFTQSMTSTAMWVFVLWGFGSQLLVTTMFFLVSFSKTIAKLALKLFTFVVNKFKFIKDKEKKIQGFTDQITNFSVNNKKIIKKPKLLISSFILVFIQVLSILSVPYFIYRAFDLSGTSYIDVIVSQSYVNLSTSMVPLPGAAGAAEIGFAAFFSGTIPETTIKSASLIWRFITYYGTIIVSAPFSRFTKDKRIREEQERIDKEFEENKEIEEKAVNNEEHNTQINETDDN